MKRLLLSFAALSCTTHLLHADLKNGDFKDGKQEWHGAGKPAVVDGDTVISVKLDKFNFSELSQTFKMPADTERVKISLAAKVTDDFTINDKSPQISKVDFAEGSQHTWTALVHAKAGLSLRFKDKASHFQYSLFKLRTGQWIFMNSEFSVKKPEALDLSIVFPPGTGTISVTLVKAEAVTDKK